MSRDSDRLAPQGDNHELSIIRPGRIHRRRVDRRCVSAAATGETTEHVGELFTIECGRRTADNGFAHLRLQFVGVYRRGFLVFDQLVRPLEST